MGMTENGGVKDEDGYGLQEPESVIADLFKALDDCEDPMVLRAAEIFFRPQRLTLHEGSLIAADEETISGTSGTPAFSQRAVACCQRSRNAFTRARY